MSAITVASQLMSNQIHPQVVDWYYRCRRNGGVAPIQQTMMAVNRFYYGLGFSGLLSKMKAICCFTPESYITATTPLIVGGGTDPWTENGSFSTNGNLNINGLKGNGNGDAGSTYLGTGLAPSTIFTLNNGGLTTYILGITGGSPFGCADSLFSKEVATFPNFGGTAYADYASALGVGGRISGTNPSGSIYYSMNRTAADNYQLYIANSYTSHRSIASTTSPPDSTLTSYPLNVFCRGEATSRYSFTDARISFTAFHDGLTTTESSTFYDLIQNLRIGIGGGYV